MTGGPERPDGRFAPIDVDRGADWHTHSTVSDGADPLAAMLAAAATAGLHTWGASDHVRTSTTWVPEYVATVRELGRSDRAREAGITVRCGVEVKMLDSAGRLDLPADLPELDYLLIADHQFPGPQGPEHPSVVRSRVEGDPDGAGPEAIGMLIQAMCAAVAASPVPAILAHPFSLLPKCGLNESHLTPSQLQQLAYACLQADAAVEVNEKWRCPAPQAVRALAAAGVRITAGSDAHRAADVGRWAYLDQLVGPTDTEASVQDRG